MTYRYIVKPVTYLVTLWCWSLAFCGPIWLASEPIVHDMMQHGFFAKALIEKRASALRAIGNYPAIIVGGSVESTLAHKASLTINPVINTISVNTLLCLDSNTMLALPFSYNAAYQFAQQKEAVKFQLKQFVLILGGQSRYNTETDLGFLKLPCKLYGAIGRFSSSELPIDSEAFYSTFLKNIMPYTVELAKSHMEKIPSLLIGIQKEDGPNSLHGTVTMLEVDKKLGKQKFIAALQYTFSNARHQIRLGPTYNTMYRRGTVHASFLNRDYNLKLIMQQMFGRWLKWDEYKLRDIKRPGHVELNWDCTSSALRLPTTLAIGYGWSSKFLGGKTNANALFARASVMLTPYAKLKVGLKVRTPAWDLAGFVAGLSIVF